MKNMFQNIKSSFFLKISFAYFIIECIIDFYNSISLDNINTFVNGVLNNLLWFLILYALGIIIQGKEVKK